MKWVFEVFVFEMRCKWSDYESVMIFERFKLKRWFFEIETINNFCCNKFFFWKVAFWMSYGIVTKIEDDKDM